MVEYPENNQRDERISLARTQRWIDNDPRAAAFQEQLYGTPSESIHTAVPAVEKVVFQVQGK